ncbi:MAG TPA: serine/threonine-protein kinase [Fibrobacteria bacterium]|nr:serine/threonine-protein kinase [Fibrobacteria bacterium]
MPPRLGRYRLLCLLGQGQMGAVYLARDPVLARLVAIKVLHSDFHLNRGLVYRFCREAKVAGRTQGPHIVQVYDLGQSANTPYLVMEFLDGVTLQSMLSYLEGEPMPPIVAASLLCQAAEGLSRVAEVGVVHRDIKPGNLMITEKGYLKITDFGMCHLSDHTLTRTGQRLGSPCFMSPEQVRGVKPITPQADLFALGVVLYYCLTGQMPFQAQTQRELYRQITEEPHPPLGKYGLDLDPFLIRLVDTLLHKDPTQRGNGPRWLRFQLKRYLHRRKVIDPAERVAAFIRDLTDEGFQTTAALGNSTVKRLQGSFDLDQRPPRRKVGGVMLFSLLVLGVLAFLGIAWKMKPTPEPLAPKPFQEARAQEARVEKKERESLSRSGKRSFPKNPDPETDSLRTRIEEKQPETFSSPATGEEKDALPNEDGEETVLSIYSSPPFVEISLDDQYLGQTPVKGQVLPPGPHRFFLKGKNGVGLDTVLVLLPGRQMHKFTLTSNPERRRPRKQQ